MIRVCYTLLITLITSSMLWAQGSFNPDHPFNPGSYKVQLVASPTEGGTVSGKGQYAQGTNVLITATPSDGYIFRGWSDGVKDAKRTIVMANKDTTLVAVFVENVYQETVKCTVVNESPYGTISFTGEVIKNSTISLKADAPDCSKFIKWSDNVLTNPRPLKATQDTTLTAIFELIQFTVTVDTEDSKKGDVDAQKYPQN